MFIIGSLYVISIQTRKQANKKISFILLSGLWILLSRFIFLSEGKYSSRYLSSILVFVLPIAAIPLYNFYIASRRISKTLSLYFFLGVIALIILIGFLKLNRFNGSRPSEYILISDILKRNNNREQQYLLDFSKEEYRLVHFVSDKDLTLVKRMDIYYSPKLYNKYNNKVDLLLNKSNLFYALVTKKDLSNFYDLQKQFKDFGKIIWKPCANLKRHYMFEVHSSSHRYGSEIPFDLVNLKPDGIIIWDSDFNDTSEIDDKKSIILLRKQGFTVDKNIIFPKKMFIHTGHGFYNHDPNSIAEIQCLKKNNTTEIIFHNEGTYVYGGIYSKEKFQIPKGTHCTVIFRGFNGGHFSISGRFIRSDNSFRFVKLHSFSILKNDQWYRGDFIINEEIKDDELFCPVIVFEGGTVSISSLVFWYPKY